MANLPRVALILTGGTIDSVGKDRLDLAWYIEAGKRLGDGELLAQLPELKTIAEVQELPFRRLPSHALVDKDGSISCVRFTPFSIRTRRTASLSHTARTPSKRPLTSST